MDRENKKRRNQGTRERREEKGEGPASQESTSQVSASQLDVKEAGSRTYRMKEIYRLFSELVIDEIGSISLWLVLPWAGSPEFFMEINCESHNSRRAIDSISSG